jgi:hypothetical protein
MPAFVDVLMAELAGSRIAERPDPFVGALVIFIRAFGVMTMAKSAIVERAAANFPSKAYRQYLEDLGFPPFLAKNFASQTISIGTRKANEARQVTKVVEAVRFLAQRGRQKRAIVSRARVVLAASKETSIVDRLFITANSSKEEFISSLRCVVDGVEIDYERIRTIAAAVAPSVPAARGRKVSAASATHEQLLEMQAFFGNPTGYYWREVDDDFVDLATRVTRLEFNEPDFDPRPACRRVKRRREATSFSRSEIKYRSSPVQGLERLKRPKFVP